jgi:hypothetical protein
MQLFEIPPEAPPRIRGDLNLPVSHILRSADVHFVSEDTLAVAYRLEAALRGRAVLTHLLFATWTADARLLDTLWIGSTIPGWEGGGGVALEVEAGGGMIVYSERTRMAIHESQDRHRWTRRALDSSLEDLVDNFRLSRSGSNIFLLTAGEGSPVLRFQSIGTSGRPGRSLMIPHVGSVWPGPTPESSLDVTFSRLGNADIGWFSSAIAWWPRGGPMNDSRSVVDYALLVRSGDSLKVANTYRLDFDRQESATALAFVEGANEPVLVLATTDDFAKKNRLRICRIPSD